jgi:hypothetical protein
MKTWTIPVENAHDFELVVDGPQVRVQRAVVSTRSEHDQPERRMATIDVETLDPTTACQLGQALLDASREAGALKAKARR